MKSAKNKIDGAKNKTIGIVKENLGKIVGSRKMEDEGIKDRAKGNVQTAVGNLKDAANSILK